MMLLSDLPAKHLGKMATAIGVHIVVQGQPARLALKLQELDAQAGTEHSITQVAVYPCEHEQREKNMV